MDINSFVLGYKKGKASGGGGGSLEGFHMVRFFNDDQTTLLYTVFVPTGASAMYAGETPVSTENAGLTFKGFEPSAENITADLDCYATYLVVSTLEETSWRTISELSAAGLADDYFAVGDTKTIHVEGTVGTLAVNDDYKVYIIGFNHNRIVEGDGIAFGTFKNTDGKDVCFVDSLCGNYQIETPENFVIRPENSNTGGWQHSTMRYQILGSVDVEAAANAGANTAISPVANTLMAALPADLRAVMKPMTIYSNNDDITVTTDYLPLLSEFEIKGTNTAGSTNEGAKQKRYTYFAGGGSAVKYQHDASSTKCRWWTRTKGYTAASLGFTAVSTNGGVSNARSDYSLGIAPIFKV